MVLAPGDNHLGIGGSPLHICNKETKYFIKTVCLINDIEEKRRFGLPSGKELQGFYRQKGDIRLKSHRGLHHTTIYQMLHHHSLCWLKPQGQRS